MRFLTDFGRFWYDFIVGDDWTVAAGVVVALIVTAIYVQKNIVPWIRVPLAVGLSLGVYAWRIAHAGPQQ